MDQDQRSPTGRKNGWAKNWAAKLLGQAQITIDGNKPWDITVHNDALYWRVFRYGSLGLGEAYMDGWWDSPSLDQFFYDIGNDLYEVMLDSELIYSCGFWKNAKNLQEAQEAKMDLICRKIGLKPGHKVLDIGGGFPIKHYDSDNHISFKSMASMIKKEIKRLFMKNIKNALVPATGPAIL